MENKRKILEVWISDTDDTDEVAITIDNLAADTDDVGYAMELMTILSKGIQETVDYHTYKENYSNGGDYFDERGI